MIFAVGSDHAGFSTKQAIIHKLTELGHQALSFGAESEDSMDYPDAADDTCQAILDGNAECGVLICGSGIGISIRANRYPHIRAALCTSEEMAILSRQHNHANVLVLAGRIVELETNLKIVDSFLKASPDMDERHKRRVEKLDRNVSCCTSE